MQEIGLASELLLLYGDCACEWENLVIAGCKIMAWAYWYTGTEDPLGIDEKVRSRLASIDKSLAVKLGNRRQPQRSALFNTS